VTSRKTILTYGRKRDGHNSSPSPGISIANAQQTMLMRKRNKIENPLKIAQSVCIDGGCINRYFSKSFSQKLVNIPLSQILQVK
jgi:hypothetical protein